MEYRYGLIAEGTKINKAIYICFEYISEKDQKRFVNKFKHTSHNRIDIMHVFRELILGAYLSAVGFKVESERKIAGKSPDWSIVDNASNLIAIAEVVNHHLDRETINIIDSKRSAGKIAVGYFPHSNDPEFLRLYSRIQDKSSKYKTLVDQINVAYVVAVFMDFESVVDVEETTACLNGGEESLFMQYPSLSGVIHFEEGNAGTYKFSFITNPYAIRKIEIPSMYFNLSGF